MSAETKWTPGPWEWDDDYKCLRAPGHWHDVLACTEPVIVEDANLIRAAPVLAVFVERFTNLLGTPKARLMDDLMVEARAALARARGERP